MKVAATVSRYLLGLMFTIFGVNGFFHFIHQPPPTGANAQQFMMAAFSSHFMVIVFLAQIVGGVLLLAGQFIPLALAILAPVLVNILNYHLTMDPGGLGVGAFATILWVLIFLRYRAAFAPLFQSRTAAEV